MTRDEHGRQLRALIDGYRSTAILHLAAKLGIADRLVAGPKSIGVLASETGAMPEALQRLVRGLIVLGIVVDNDDATITLTQLGEQLCDRPGTAYGRAILAGEEYAPAWAALGHGVTTGGNPFRHVFGVSNWEHRRAHPEIDRCFNEEMASLTAGLVPWIVSTYDFSRFARVADLAGGNGTLLIEILRACPRTHGILFEQAHVVEHARRRLSAVGLGVRCQLVAGDLFESIAVEADLFVLKSVLHDWDDDRAAIILRHCRNAIAPSGRLLVVDRVMPDHLSAGSGSEVVMQDLHMFAVNHAGKERTLAEFTALFAAAGFTLTSARWDPTFPLGLLEATADRSSSRSAPLGTGE